MRVMIVEDEFLVASAVEALLEAMGHEIIGPFATVDAAIATLDQGSLPDAAIVDLNLRGHPSAPVAEELVRRHIPFIFASGYDADGNLRQRFPAAGWLRKPYTEQQMTASLARLGRPAGGTDEKRLSPGTE